MDGDRLREIHITITGGKPMDTRDRGRWAAGFGAIAILTFAVATYAYNGKQVNGTAVSAQIWRIHTQTLVNERVVTYVKSDDGCDPTVPRPAFNLWSLSADARWAGCQVKSACVGGENRPHSFPPPGGDILSAAARASLPGCNDAVSASGSFVTNYLYAGHSQLFICKWDHRSGESGDGIGGLTLVSDAGYPQLQQWSGTDIGMGGSQIVRWSTNSDKWVCRDIHWCENSNYSMNAWNQVLVNWKDSVAIFTSHNVADRCDSWAGIRRGDCAGDFWISDPVNNPNGNKYEDENGAWHAIDTTPIDRRAGQPRPMEPDRILFDGRSVTMVGSRPFSVRIVDVKGAFVFSQLASGTVTIATDRLAPGSYVVRVARGENAALHRFTVQRRTR